MFLHAFSQQLKDSDLDSIMAHYAAQKGLSFHDTDTKKMVIQSLAKDTMSFLRDQGPKETVALMQRRIQELEAKLSEKVPDTPGSKGRAVHTPRTRLPTRSPSTDRPIPVAEDEEDYLAEVRRGDKEPYLQSKAPTGRTTASVSTWLSKLKVPTAKAKKIEDMAKTVLAAYNALEEKDRGEDLQRLAIELGLPIALTSKMEANALIKAVAAASVLAKR